MKSLIFDASDIYNKYPLIFFCEKDNLKMYEIKLNKPVLDFCK